MLTCERIAEEVTKLMRLSDEEKTQTRTDVLSTTMARSSSLASLRAEKATSIPAFILDEAYSEMCRLNEVTAGNLFRRNMGLRTVRRF